MSDALVVVQARTTSSRLPSKVLAPIGAEPMVLHVLRRAAAIGEPVVLATSSDPSDDALAALVEAAGFAVHRGALEDVLDRFVGTIPQGTRCVVRVTADCPLFDPAVGRAVLAALRASGADYVSNILPPTFPDGLDCEAFTADALRAAWREARRPSDREHVTPYFRRHSERFRILNVAHVPDLSTLRWTVDDERDLRFVRVVHEELVRRGASDTTSMRAVLRVLADLPELARLNEGTPRDAAYARSVEREAAARAADGAARGR